MLSEKEGTRLGILGEESSHREEKKCLAVKHVANQTYTQEWALEIHHINIIAVKYSLFMRFLIANLWKT